MYQCKSTWKRDLEVEMHKESGSGQRTGAIEVREAL